MQSFKELNGSEKGFIVPGHDPAHGTAAFPAAETVIHLMLVADIESDFCAAKGAVEPVSFSALGVANEVAKVGGFDELVEQFGRVERFHDLEFMRLISWGSA